MKEDGYIKFRCKWDKRRIEIPEEILNSLNAWRDKLFNLSLIGALDNGVGFGNISLRINGSSFYITGSATGGKNNLTPDDYALVNAWQISENLVHCVGKTRASSEAMSHAAIYQSNTKIGAVIHVHNEAMWQHYLNKLPTSGKEIAYGTPVMAAEITALLSHKTVKQKGIIVMGGHREGILTFGKDLEAAGKILLDFYTQSANNTAIS